MTEKQRIARLKRHARKLASRAKVYRESGAAAGELVRYAFENIEALAYLWHVPDEQAREAMEGARARGWDDEKIASTIIVTLKKRAAAHRELNATAAAAGLGGQTFNGTVGSLLKIARMAVKAKHEHLGFHSPDPDARAWLERGVEARALASVARGLKGAPGLRIGFEGPNSTCATGALVFTWRDGRGRMRLPLQHAPTACVSTTVQVDTRVAA